MKFIRILPTVLIAVSLIACRYRRQMSRAFHAVLTIVLAAFFLVGCSTPQEARWSETVSTDHTTSDPEIMLSPMPATFWEWCEVDMEAKGQVAVHGEARRPGVYELPSPPSLLSCISMVGGFTDYGHKKGVRLHRGGEMFVYNLWKMPHEEPDVEVQAGDRIEVKLIILFGPNPRGEIDWMPPRWKKAKAYYAAIHKACDSGAYCDGECLR